MIGTPSLTDLWALTAPINPETEAPLPPTRQQMASWVVEAWDKITEELCAKAWVACGYKTQDQLDGDNETGVVAYSEEQVGRMVEKIIGGDAFVNYCHDAALVNQDPPHPDEEDSDYSDVVE